VEVKEQLKANWSLSRFSVSKSMCIYKMLQSDKARGLLQSLFNLNLALASFMLRQ